ncbi:MAG: hypothetical protein FJZ10_00280 [Candidatus Omnitrophica bacterium]|nr:hypothetical protein [Candidatus Omnitrophota bacterium]
MFRLIKNKKGFLTPFAYFVTIVMSLYVAAFVKQTIDGHFINKRNLYNLQGKYQAMRGIEYATFELGLQGEEWHTHTAQLNGGEYILTPSPQPPHVILNDTCEIDEDGNYAAKDGSFAVMCFMSPASGKTIIHSKGGDANIYGSRLEFRNLVNYFVFTPNELLLSYITLDSLDTNLGGGIHSNKDIIFGDNARLLNTAELSTPEAIRYFAESYVPQGVIPDFGGKTWEQYYYWLRDPWLEPYRDTFGDLYRNRNDGHLSGENAGLLMENPRRPGHYIDWDPTSGQPYIDPDKNPYIYANQELISQINGNNLPNRLSSYYNWNMYWRMQADLSWRAPNVEIPVNYTNSKLQPQDWNELMQAKGLENIVKESGTGGEEINPYTIDSLYYLSEAQKNGVYITNNNADGLNVKLGNEIMLTNNEGKIIINGDVVFELKEFKNTNSTQTNRVAIVYVDKMIENELSPPNGIMYANGVGLVLDNSETLPQGGLTTVSNQNIYLKGDYNTTEWQPSAAIAAGFAYLLSDQFNYPETLPITFHNLEFPYRNDFIPGVRNWYANRNANMANPVDKDYTYVVSIISHDLLPHTLERWSYYNNPGDINNPPSYDNVIKHKRKVVGSLIQLPSNNFTMNQPDIIQKGSRQRINPGWPEDMASILPKGEFNFFSYDEHYLDVDSPKPPGCSVPINKLTIKLPGSVWSEKIYYPPLY